MVRHAQASFGGADYDVLSPHGAAQAAALAADLRRRGIRIERVVTGRLARQRDTGDPIARMAGCALTEDPRWDEYDADDILEHHSTSLARHSRPPGSDAPAISSREFQDVIDEALLAWLGAGGSSPALEAWPAFEDRIARALADATTGVSSGATAVVCTSAGVLAATAVACLGLPVETFVAFNHVSVNTGVTKIIQGRSGTTLVSFNEHGHLEHDGESLLTYR